MEPVRPLSLDLYDDYDTYSNYEPNIFDFPSQTNRETLLTDGLKSAYKWKGNSALKGSAAIQFVRDVEDGIIKRPITAVHGAGYVSRSTKSVFDPLNLASHLKTSVTDSPKELTLEERIKGLENQVMRLIDESCIAEHAGNFKLALEKAKEASSKEHSLIQLLEQSGHDDSHNFELTYSVLFTVAHQYVTNEMYTEALNMYKAITKNKAFQNGIRLKINIGNIYAQLGM